MSGDHRALAALVSLAIVASLTADAAAQGIQGLAGGDGPLEISADEGIEWRRDDQMYLARGNARAAQQDVELFAQVLSAHYREENGKTEIFRINADGAVRIVTPEEEVVGDHAVYFVDRGVFVITGEDLRLTTQQEVITARDSLEYWEELQIAVARGDAVVVREDKRLTADLLTAHFKPGGDGKQGLALDQVIAKGDVRISTATEFASGDRAVYFADLELATLEGDVKITRDDNQLNGGYAEVNLATGVSRLLGAPPGKGGDTRVRGLISPKEQEGLILPGGGGTGEDEAADSAKE